MVRVAKAWTIHHLLPEPTLSDHSAAARPGTQDATSGRIDVAQGQIDFEWDHLMKKLEARAPKWYALQLETAKPLAHPLFRVRPGGVAEWERV